MTRSRSLVLVTVVAASLALPGCGVDDPYNDAPDARAQQESATATPAVTPASAEQPAGERTALKRFAETYINWTFDSLPSVRAGLVEQATDELRETLLQQAREAANDASRRASTQSNEGTVEGVLLRPGRPAFVITHETARFGGEAMQSVYMIYEAEAERTDTGWKVSGWRAVN